MRIAWTGETGSRGAAGVSGISFQLLDGLARLGHEIDAFVVTENGSAPSSLDSVPGVTLVRHETWWRWNRWYSKGSLASFLSSSAARLQLQRRLAHHVLERHRVRGYDVIFQMSQFESFFGERTASRPALVVHPCTIAGAEAEWHYRERGLARETESAPKFYLVDAMLRARALSQVRHARRPDVIVGPSEIFVQELSRRYGVSREACAVLRHPADLALLNYDPAEAGPRAPAELLFVSRISSRKGVEMVIELSKRLGDLAGEVEIVVVGGHTLWSDYTGLLEGLDPSVARYAGELPGVEVIERMRRASLLLVPSRFEPGSIATGEALSVGLPVVASDAVGPSEILSTASGRVFPDGDINRFEQAVREALAQLSSTGMAMRQAARSVAEAELDSNVIVARLEAILLGAVG